MTPDQPTPGGQSMPPRLALPATGARQGRIARLVSAIQLSLLRMTRGPWLLAVVAVGMLAIDILACVVPLYLQLITTTQLQTTIAQAAASARNMQISMHSDATDRALQEQIAEQVEAQAQQYLTAFSTAKPLTYLTSDQLTLIHAGSYTYARFSEVQRTQFDAFDFRAMLPHMRLIAGELPPSSPAPAGQPTPVLITQEMALPSTSRLASVSPLPITAIIAR